MKRLAPLLTLVWVACGPPPAPPTTLTQLEAEVWTKSCAFTSCHKGTGASGLNLEGSSFEKLVNVASSQVPSRKLVVPMDPGASYLMEKLEKPMPAMGTQMPPAQALDAATIARVRAWIAAGAQKN